MASVVVNGDTSGAVTLSAPAVAGTVTVTLPSTNGTMAVLPTATGVLTEAAGGTGTTTGYYGFKNRIINGAMVIDQRNAGAAITPTAAVYTLDRWEYAPTVASKLTIQQNAGSLSAANRPAGFINYLGITSTSSYSLLSGDYFTIRQNIEGLNAADLGWGTANASTVTLSFWARSSLTGTHSGSIYNIDGTRSYVFSFTVVSANTWEYKTITIAGDTTGTWVTTNAVGIRVGFSLGTGPTYSGTAGSWNGTLLLAATGSVNVVGTNGATFYITGVQLEKGSTATSFDYRPYGTELQLVQRYYYQYTGNASAQTPIASAFLASTVSAQGLLQFPVPMRAAPTQTSSSAADIEVTWSAGTSATSALTLDLASTLNASLRITTTGLTTGQGGYFRIGIGATKYLAFSAEL